MVHHTLTAVICMDSCDVSGKMAIDDVIDPLLTDQFLEDNWCPGRQNNKFKKMVYNVRTNNIRKFSSSYHYYY